VSPACGTWARAEGGLGRAPSRILVRSGASGCRHSGSRRRSGPPRGFDPPRDQQSAAARSSALPPVLTGHVSSLPRTNWTCLVPPSGPAEHGGEELGLERLQRRAGAEPRMERLRRARALSPSAAHVECKVVLTPLCTGNFTRAQRLQKADAGALLGRRLPTCSLCRGEAVLQSHSPKSSPIVDARTEERRCPRSQPTGAARGSARTIAVASAAWSAAQSRPNATARTCAAAGPRASTSPLWAQHAT
jgi:hypothetical protein